jgi:translation initiation factor eIF-2B subunit delta
MNDPYETLPSNLAQMLEAIKADNRSGAAEILTKATAVYVAARSCDRAAVSPRNSDVLARGISSMLREAQPDMAGLLNMVRRVEQAVARAGGHAPLEAAAEAAVEFCESASAKASASAGRAAELITEGAVVLTHSRSSTVLAAFRDAARRGRSFSVIATEGRPMLEGREVAEALSKMAVGVTLIVDSAAALVMDTVDLVLVGADRVTPAHIVNKIGTRMIALAARDQGIPIYCLADTTKFIGSKQSVRPRSDRAGSEVWPDHPPRIAIINRYFEEVPIDLFTGVVTESGPLEPAEAGRQAADS